LSAEVAYALITRPSHAMRRIRSAGSPGSSALMLIAASASFAVSFLLTSALYTGGKGPGLVAVVIVGRVLLALVGWLLLGGLIHSAACLMGGYGHFAKFLAAYAMASMPFTLCTPVALLLSLLGVTGLVVFAFVVLPILAAWWWGLTIAAIKEIYALSTGAAVVVSILPYALVIVTLLVALVSGVATICALGFCS